ncbi:DNA translocase SpoIIIE [Pirellula sp. SH-Sr6A]|uniref:FtsK/SpoIIIE family DNA translocase n=1 Tax=Pirellula sp. SH-Sr6A TaxID=1632865 RepID=UPI00078C373E|nr:DNA translocase FtsK [Pirellula sp. SH-Sr6A]AMV33895.1 DNA translocase SpoIIIE [Pirellula sp. SH-Sr6A]
MENQRSVRWDVAAVVMFAASSLVWLSLLSHDAADNLGEMPRIVQMLYTPMAPAYPANESVQNSCGYIGALLSDILLQATGIGAYLLAGLMVLSGIVMLRQKPWASSLGRSMGWSLILLSVCCLPGRLGMQPSIPVPIGAGGYLGTLCNLWMDNHLAHAGGTILVLGIFAGGMLLSTEYALVRYFGYAATGSLIAARYFRIPTWSWRRHQELLTGVFSPKRADLPNSVTMRQDPTSVSAMVEQTAAPKSTSVMGMSAIRSAVESVTQALTGPARETESNDELEGESHQDQHHEGPDGPQIRIGRRASATISTSDLASDAKASVRTDLSFPKPKTPPTLPAIAGGLLGDAKKNGPPPDDELLDSDEELEDEYEYAEDEEYDDDGEYSEEDEGDYDDGEEDEVHTEEEEPEEIISPEPRKKRSLTIRSDATHIEERVPKIKTGQSKKKEPPPEEVPVEEDPADSLQEMDDTKLPEGTEEYALPGLDLLTESDDISYDEQTEEVKRKAKVLEQTFANFGFNVRVVEVETGPVIAQYEIELEAGLRLSKITGLADDLAIALRVPSVRIVAPIPGKNSVGIEVPNEKRQIVRMREVIEESGPQIRKQKIPLFLGKDVSGKSLTVDLASLPHLLIAGRTGTGKSVCLNSIISSILMTRRPDEVRMLMIDPKMVELSCYGRLPHLMHPVVIDMRKAEAILAWAVDKMEERYALLARAGVRHLTNYNQLGREELLDRLKPENDDEADLIPDHLPFIVIVVDEMADLMMTAGKEVEAHIIRLAQKSRAVGIHLILATQKPTVDVITGLIKSNLPARISFQVASRTDSRVVLDEMGADKLLGNGDMLFLWPGTSQLLRGQGTYLSDDEINAIVDHCSMGGVQNFVQELVQLKVNKDEGEGVKPGSFKKRDDLYEAAVDIVVREGRGSCSLLQRALGVGYGRAARLIDFMAEDGIVGEYNGSQAREVQITVQQWEEMRANAEGEPAPTSKGRGKKMRRDEGLSQAKPPKSSKKRKSRSKSESEEAFVGSDGEDDEIIWQDDE